VCFETVANVLHLSLRDVRAEQEEL